MNSTRLLGTVLALGMALGAPLVQALPTSGHSERLLSEDVGFKGTPALTVTSPAFKDGGHIPYENTQYRGNIFPGLAWTRGPAGTRSYVVIFQGLETEGNHAGGTVIAMTVFNIPAAVTKLDAGMTAAPAGALLGPNVRGPNKPYAGPHVKVPGQHSYFIQVFALDSVLPSDPETTYEQLAAAMKGHVVAGGVLHAKSDKDPDSKE